jgi:hypothetical protein
MKLNHSSSISIFQTLKSFKKQTVTSTERILITYPNLDKFICHFEQFIWENLQYFAESRFFVTKFWEFKEMLKFE